MNDWHFWVAFFVIAGIVFVFVMLEMRKDDRKRAEDQEYQNWLAEHGFKPKEKK